MCYEDESKRRFSHVRAAPLACSLVAQLHVPEGAAVGERIKFGSAPQTPADSENKCGHAVPTPALAAGLATLNLHSRRL